MSRKGTEITLKQKAKDEERIKEKSIKLVRDMHHNNATTQKRKEDSTKKKQEKWKQGGAFEGHWKWLALQDHQERGKSFRSSCLKSWEHDMFYYLLLV